MTKIYKITGYDDELLDSLISKFNTTVLKYEQRYYGNTSPFRTISGKKRPLYELTSEHRSNFFFEEIQYNFFCDPIESVLQWHKSDATLLEGFPGLHCWNLTLGYYQSENLAYRRFQKTSGEEHSFELAKLHDDYPPYQEFYEDGTVALTARIEDIGETITIVSAHGNMNIDMVWTGFAGYEYILNSNHVDITEEVMGICLKHPEYFQYKPFQILNDEARVLLRLAL